METFTVSLVTFFATIGPLDIAVMFIALTAKHTKCECRKIAVKACFIAFTILFVFMLIGQFILQNLGITLESLRTGGGILLLIIAIKMVFDTSNSTSIDETSNENNGALDISVFPVATPLIAGPASIAASILLISSAESSVQQSAVVLGMATVLLFTCIFLCAGAQIKHAIGATGLSVITRVFGVLLAALAAQYIIDGVLDSIK